MKKEGKDSIIDTFESPADCHRGTDLYMLNDRLEKDELIRQIKGMYEQGFRSFIARTYIGLQVDYPSDEFTSHMKTIIDTAKDCGMEVYLQAGFVPEAIPDLPDEYAQQLLVVVEPDEGKDKTVLTEFDNKAVIVNTRQHSLNLLKAEGVQFYLSTSYERFWEKFRDEFGISCKSIWVDEPSFRRGVPWSENLPEAFRKQWGYDLIDSLALLFKNEGEYKRVRYHYWRTVVSLLKDVYFTEIEKWCRSNNLSFSGHLLGEDSIRSQIIATGNCMPLYEHFSVPGIDIISGDINFPHRNINNHRFLITPLQCVSAAHQMGKEDILCEMFGVSSENLTMEKQKFMFDYLFSLGITKKCFHAVFYSLKGNRKRRYAPHINYQQPYWKDYGLFTDYCARVSWFSKQGNPYADVLLLSPIENAYMELDLSPDSKEYNDVLYKMDFGFMYLLRFLRANQVLFELGDEETICRHGFVKDGRIGIGHMLYKTVILPDLAVLRKDTLKLLKEFSASGGKIVLMGQRPYLLDGIETDEIGKAFEKMNIRYCNGREELPDVIKSVVDCEFEIRSFVQVNDLSLNYRKDENNVYTMILNSDSKKTYRGEMEITGSYNTWHYQAVTGDITAYPSAVRENKTIVELELKPCEMLLLEWRKTEPDDRAKAKSISHAPKLSIPVSGKWQAERSDPNCMLLEFCRYQKENTEISDVYPLMGVLQQLMEQDYHGRLTLYYDFIMKKDIRSVSLVMETPENKDINVNGQCVEYRDEGFYIDRSFKVIPIGSYVKEGINTISITMNFEPVKPLKNRLFSLFTTPKGTELENIYLIGDFGVYGIVEPTDTDCVRLNRSFALDEEKKEVGSELTVEGYPFYTGDIVLRKKVILDTLHGQRASLNMDVFNGCVARLKVNKTDAGVLFCRPYTFDISGLLKPGENELEIRITNTLRNIIGPFHHPEGDNMETWTGAYGGLDHSWTGGYNKKTRQFVPEWFNHREIDSATWVESYLQVPFGIDGISICIY